MARGASAPHRLLLRVPRGGWLKRDAGDVRVFFVADYSVAETGAEAVFGGAESGQLTGTIAVDSVVSEGLLFGGEISAGGGEIDLGSTEAKWTSFGVGFFGMAQISDAFYVSAAGGFELIAFDELDRTVTLGPSVETYAADPDANRFYIRVGAGASLPVAPDVMLTPEAAYAHDRLRIDAYEEELGAASIAYGENEIESSRLIGALTLDAAPRSMPGWSFSLRGSYEHELEDERHDIKVGSSSNGVGELSFERYDGGYGVLYGKIGRAIGAGVLSLGVGATLPEEGEAGFNGAVSFEMGL